VTAQLANTSAAQFRLIKRTQSEKFIFHGSFFRRLHGDRFAVERYARISEQASTNYVVKRVLTVPTAQVILVPSIVCTRAVICFVKKRC
jgi:hypothetical protein